MSAINFKIINVIPYPSSNNQSFPEVVGGGGCPGCLVRFELTRTNQVLMQNCGQKKALILFNRWVKGCLLLRSSGWEKERDGTHVQNLQLSNNGPSNS